MVDQPPLHRSAEIEDLAHLTPAEINKPLVTPEKKSKQALLLVDLQNDYFPGGKWPLNGMERAAENAVRLLEVARASADLLVFVRHEFPSNDAPFFTPGSPGAELHGTMASRADEDVVLKHHVNAFRETKLKAILERNEIEEVVICGAMSHMCIDATTRAASDFGYKCVVIHDACATREAEFNGVRVPAESVHAAVMAALAFAYAKVISTEEFLKSKQTPA